MRYALTFIAGFALGIYAVNVMSYGTWRRALLSLECRAEGRAGIWDSDRDLRVCADLSDAYSEDEAFNRFISRILAAHEKPH